MPLVGKAITAHEVVADPRNMRDKLELKDVTTKKLSEFTMEQKERHDLEATKLVNSFKSEYGTGVSALIRIYNASGHTLKFLTQGPDWSGHMWKYTFDDTIQNGQWSVVLHVKTAWASKGSNSCFVYKIVNEDNPCDVFCGWSLPWDVSQYLQANSNQVITFLRQSGTEWPTWDEVYYKICDSGKSCSCKLERKGVTMKCEAIVGDNTSPIVNYIISAQ